MHLVSGRYKCDWCGADIDAPFEARDTMEIITEHDDVDVRIILVNGDEHHRCERQREAP
jgi:hypothetical protein